MGKCCISLNCCAKGYEFMYIYWALEILVTILQVFLPDYFLVKGNKESEFSNLVCIVIAALLAVFIIICNTIKNCNNNDQIKRTDSIHSDTIKRENTNNCLLIFLLLIISLLHFISISSFFLFYLITEICEMEGNGILKNYQIDWLIALDILIRFSFSYCILKEKAINILDILLFFLLLVLFL